MKTTSRILAKALRRDTFLDNSAEAEEGVIEAP